MAGTPKNVFISYSHKDLQWLKRLRLYLAPLERLGSVKLWDDTQLRAGEDWRTAFQTAVDSAHTIILLISANYLASDFVSVELSKVLPAAAKKGARVLLLNIDYADLSHSALAQFQSINDPARPLSSLPRLQRDKVLVGIPRLIESASELPALAPPSKALAPELAAQFSAPLSRPQALFICYRREDTQDAAGRLRDGLVNAYGEARVFMDIDSVPLGIDFVEHVTEQIGKCSAVIVMIGKQWQTIKDKKRRRRLDIEDDLVRAEIRAALQQRIPVIPVTVQNAAMPQAEDLPDDIRLLARRNGIELSATRWKTDVERLIKELDRVMKL